MYNCTSCNKPATVRTDFHTTIYGTIVESPKGTERLCDDCFSIRVPYPQHVADAYEAARASFGRY